MKVLFHLEKLVDPPRGVAVSVFDYARYNQEILGNESIIVHGNAAESSVAAKFKDQFNLIKYDSEEHLNEIASKYDFCYSQRAGKKVDIDGRVLPNITSTKFGVHSVFQWYDPHGDVYAYISEWLAQNVSETYSAPLHPFVPYIVEMPDPIYDLREMIGIPKDKLVFGRHGGHNTFDLPFVKDMIKRIVSERDDIVFLFLGTDRFMDHSNVIHLDSTFDRKMISSFIHACDAMLHARELGESFGLAISEFLYHNKPVLAWNGGFDRNHVHMLSQFNSLYRDERECYDLIANFRDLPNQDYRKAVQSFSPTAVMQQFQKVFL